MAVFAAHQANGWPVGPLLKNTRDPLPQGVARGLGERMGLRPAVVRRAVVRPEGEAVLLAHGQRPGEEWPHTFLFFGPKVWQFTQPRPTAWGRGAPLLLCRPNGPTVLPTNDWALGGAPISRTAQASTLMPMQPVIAGEPLPARAAGAQVW